MQNAVYQGELHQPPAALEIKMVLKHKNAALWNGH